MPDPPRNFDVTISKPTLETQHFQRHSASVSTTSIGSGYSCSQPPAVRCASFSVSSPSRFELSQNESLPRSPRRLPIPPTYASPPASSLPMPSSSPSSLLSSLSTLSLSTPRHPPHSYSVRPLPRVPNSVPILHETSRHKDGAYNDERLPRPASPATSTISSMMSRQSTDVEEIRRGNLSKLRRHLGYSVPLDFIIPSLDRDKESDSSSSDEDEEWCDMPPVPMTPQRLSELTEAISPILESTADEKVIRRYSRRWLREKKGRRWVEDDYSVIIQSLRALR